MTRTPFAVKGGGHSHNLGFSSTSGVHISMARFKDIVIHEDSGTVEIGAGLTWGEVYAHLVPKGINIVGGRMDPVGVAGFTLGGGYSWKSNQYGLAVDNVVGYELVLPNGKVKVVTDKDEDLFFGLKGGFNNFGIVTKFTVKSHKQTDIWAASFKYVGEQIAEAQAAMAKFVTREHDHKGAQFGVYIYTKGSLLFEISLFYDGPELPQGLYDEFFDLPNTSRSIFKGSYAAFVESMSHLMPEQRNGYSHGSPILHLTEPIIKAIANETEFWGEWLSKHDENVLVSSAFDPFEPDYLTHGGPSAHPPDRSRAYLPASMFIAWSKPLVEKYMEDAIRRSGEALVTAGIRDGQDLENAAPYVNYVMFDTPLEKMYGGGLERLREIRREYDPEDVMGLTGGWKF
ncbi:hypothetical protein B0F90DRAFT_1761958 [Multifurca ochricompacta]|uniref:FAD-binding PCMH-type domain-containing protein n=1 Tax=Multifurca ochricompacta TaxID=376703 RepID=A0AAD4QK78_9AGAM|nr:hypothetical protein B0F90DRAFT_1761958 [Multifurca ochricompacta]